MHVTIFGVDLLQNYNVMGTPSTPLHLPSNILFQEIENGENYYVLSDFGLTRDRKRPWETEQDMLKMGPLDTLMMKLLNAELKKSLIFMPWE